MMLPVFPGCHAMAPLPPVNPLWGTDSNRISNHISASEAELNRTTAADHTAPKRKSQRSLTMRALIALALMTAPAFADSVTVSGSTITLQQTTRPGAVAEVVFENRAVNSSLDEGEYDLTHGDIAMPFAFNWNESGDSDAITVTPPEGITCLPTSCILRLPEHETGTLFLFDALGVGM